MRGAPSDLTSPSNRPSPIAHRRDRVLSPKMAQTTVFEALPYVDREPTAEERAAAHALIEAEVGAADPTTASAADIAPYAPTYTPLLQQEIERAAAGRRLDAIDLTRYEAQDDDDDVPSDVARLRPALERAYTAQSYLTARHAHLRLLDGFGKNAWLVGNWQTEAELAAVERELAHSKRNIELVNNERRRMQVEVGEELKGLDATWRRGVSRVLETELAVEKLNQELRQRRGE